MDLRREAERERIQYCSVCTSGRVLDRLDHVIVLVVHAKRDIHDGIDERRDRPEHGREILRKRIEPCRSARVCKVVYPAQDVPRETCEDRPVAAVRKGVSEAENRLVDEQLRVGLRVRSVLRTRSVPIEVRVVLVRTAVVCVRCNAVVRKVCERTERVIRRTHLATDYVVQLVCVVPAVCPIDVTGSLANMLR